MGADEMYDLNKDKDAGIVTGDTCTCDFAHKTCEN